MRFLRYVGACPTDPLCNDIGIVRLLRHEPFVNQGVNQCARECCANVSRRRFPASAVALRAKFMALSSAFDANRKRIARCIIRDAIHCARIQIYVSARTGVLLVLLPRTEFILVTQFRLLVREFVWVHLA